MKVLSNLLGNNTKINANVIALKDTNNNPCTLEEYLTPTTLYEDVEGTLSGITLSDNIENYKEYQIIYSREGSGYCTIRMPVEYKNDVALITSIYLGNILRFYIAHVNISGNTLGRPYDNYINFTGTNALNFSTAMSIRIHKVIGYK